MLKLIEYLKKIWTGNCTKKEYLLYFFVAFGIYIIGIIIAASLYPGGFSMTTVYVSYLGGTTNNPDGYIIYNICEVITGILLVPHFIYLYKRLVPALKIIALFSCFMGILGSLGFAAIGIYHQGYNALGHQITTWIAFGGFGVSAVFMIFVLLRKIMLKHSWPSIWSFLLAYGVTIALLAFTLVADNNPELFISMGIDEAYLNDKFLEWFYLFIVMSWFIGLALISKDNKN